MSTKTLTRLSAVLNGEPSRQSSSPWVMVENACHASHQVTPCPPCPVLLLEALLSSDRDGEGVRATVEGRGDTPLTEVGAGAFEENRFKRRPSDFPSPRGFEVDGDIVRSETKDRWDHQSCYIPGTENKDTPAWAASWCRGCKSEPLSC